MIVIEIGDEDVRALLAPFVGQVPAVPSDAERLLTVPRSPTG
jgi:hypothetical protein